jgi:hypothetical protein
MSDKAVRHHKFCVERLGDLNRLALFRHGRVLPDNEEGRAMLEELLIATENLDAAEDAIVEMGRNARGDEGAA